MPTRHFGSLPKSSRTRLRVSLWRRTTFPSASTPWIWNIDLAISNPIVVTCFIIVLHPVHPQPCCGRGGEPSTSSKAVLRNGGPNSRDLADTAPDAFGNYARDQTPTS